MPELLAVMEQPLQHEPLSLTLRHKYVLVLLRFALHAHVRNVLV
jgi:hypothetical protein